MVAERGFVLVLVLSGAIQSLGSRLCFQASGTLGQNAHQSVLGFDLGSKQGLLLRMLLIGGNWIAIVSERV
ncbi:hypothetical protein CPC08DRAFT_711652 [Agrocybe pediades]|nr:hypothetical protein CPC08DRAFT_711652 [Agrocybe pediades]